MIRSHNFRHKEWRKLAKKFMRKRKRSRIARERDAKIQEGNVFIWESRVC